MKFRQQRRLSGAFLSYQVWHEGDSIPKRAMGLRSVVPTADSQLAVMREPTTKEVFDAILAGSPAADIGPMLSQLGAEDRHNLLSTVCAMRKDIALNCRSTAAEVDELLRAECPLQVDGCAICRS